jgi:hypothetical protein
MPFVKLDCGILDSTVWIDRDRRELFITALLMASPKEYSEPIPQYHVDHNETTGFIAPAGWYGFVEAAGPGIVRRALVEPETGMIALAALGEPDPESRNPKFEGRRLIRVVGGYLVLNFQDYRDRDYTMAERSRRYRERKLNKRQQTQPLTRSDTVTSRRDITQAEAESEAKEYINPKSAPPSVKDAGRSGAKKLGEEKPVEPRKPPKSDVMPGEPRFPLPGLPYGSHRG